MKKMSKIFALVMVCAMCMSLMSVSVFAGSKSDGIHIKDVPENVTSVTIKTNDGKEINVDNSEKENKWQNDTQCDTDDVAGVTLNYSDGTSEELDLSYRTESGSKDGFYGAIIGESGNGTLNIWIEGNKPAAEEEAAKKAAEEEATIEEEVKAEETKVEEKIEKTEEKAEEKIEKIEEKASEPEVTVENPETIVRNDAEEIEETAEEVEEEIIEEEVIEEVKKAPVTKKTVVKEEIVDEEIEEDIVPLAAAPVEVDEEIEEDIIPLAAAPELENAEDLDELFDEEIPLAAVPQTSDSAMLWVVLMLLSGTAAAGLTVLNDRKVNG